jgi:hypothetical protein
MGHVELQDFYTTKNLIDPKLLTSCIEGEYVGRSIEGVTRQRSEVVVGLAVLR